MSYYLFLDDERIPSHVKWMHLPRVAWNIVRDYGAFVRCIEERGMPIHISFDHDLADAHYPTKPQTGDEFLEYNKMKEKTGYHCAKWLIDYCLDNNVKLPQFSVHSLNVVGKKNIIQLLENFAKLQNEQR